MLQNDPQLKSLINKLWQNFRKSRIANPLAASEQINFQIDMKYKINKLALFTAFTILILESATAQQTYEYKVSKLTSPIVIDANWNKPQWAAVDSLSIENNSGSVPKFTPTTFVKLLYDDQNIYVIFKVQDKFVRCIVNDINGPVWDQSCAEFFFSPDSNFPEKYFNLEVTCGGTPLICYNSFPLELNYLDTTDIKKIEIAHSMPEIVYPEIKDSVTWTLEYRIPLEILRKFSDVTTPNSGVLWRANFYKTASTTSNPHYFTWAKVVSPSPNFHLPQYFGVLKFENASSVGSTKTSNIEIYPNPTGDFISLKGLDQSASLRIFNVLGSQVALFTNLNERLDVTELNAGVYFVNIVSGKNNVIKKFIKK